MRQFLKIIFTNSQKSESDAHTKRLEKVLSDHSKAFNEFSLALKRAIPPKQDSDTFKGNSK